LYRKILNQLHLSARKLSLLMIAIREWKSKTSLISFLIISIQFRWKLTAHFYLCRKFRKVSKISQAGNGSGEKHLILNWKTELKFVRGFWKITAKNLIGSQ